MMNNLGSHLHRWLEERLRLSSLKEAVRRFLDHPLPANVGLLHTLGFVLLALFLVQGITGVLLMFYYRPAGDSAFQSVRYIIDTARLGGLIHNLHSLAPTLIVITLILHMSRVYFFGAYKKPREVTWMVGVLLLTVTLALGFTGSLLPWDQSGYWATTVGTAFVEGLPVIGHPLLLLVRGSQDVSEMTLSRFFTLHVVLLPACWLLLVSAHVALVRLHNAAPLTPTTVPENKGEALFAESGKRYVPHHLRKELTVAYAVLGLLLLLALLVSPELGPKADPLHTPAGIKPAWYFLPLYQMMKYLPGSTGILLVLAGAAVLFALPLLDRSPFRHPRKRRLAISLGVLILATSLVLGGLGYVSGTTRVLLGKHIYFDMKGVPHTTAPTGTSPRQSTPAEEQ